MYIKGQFDNLKKKELHENGYKFVRNEIKKKYRKQ